MTPLHIYSRRKETERPLTGPTCPYCGHAFRRRRYWARFDRAVCPGCGTWAECIGETPLSFSFAASREARAWRLKHGIPEPEKDTDNVNQ